jgi:acyl-[acyl carrier protein]--UDP-N-acetylglucosamine O-acyltransferase
MKVSQDVPKYMMVAGERAELRGLNLVGLTRRGFNIEEVYAHKMILIYLSSVICHCN